MNYLFWDTLNRIKNGQLAKKKTVLVVKTKISQQLLKILWDEGFIMGYKVDSFDSKFYSVQCKYDRIGKPVIKNCKFLSKPGSRVFCSSKNLWKIQRSKISFFIFSTSEGLLSLENCKKKRLGGELLCQIL